jgi:hypothetical protein
MAYTEINFKTKKAIKDHLTAQARYDTLVADGAARPMTIGAVILQKEFPRGRPADLRVYQPGLGTVPENGRIALEGPHYPAPHTWYAEGTMANGKLVKIK